MPNFDSEMLLGQHNMKKALLLVDLQNDFCTGGSLAVKNSEEVVTFANKIQPFFDLVVATKDWHPANHKSFAANHPGARVGDVINMQGYKQILWPNHCVQNTSGADFHPELHVTQIKKIFFKGTDEAIDSYSAFFDNQHLRATGLADYLQQEKVTDIFVLGLATD